MAYLEDYTISTAFTEAHHPNQNLAERRGGMLKTATTHLLRITGAPSNYWCYALEYMCLVRTVTARRSLDWLSPHERHWGDRPDISVFRFVFWEPIWYYNPRQAFPKSKMLKGRFLGIARNVGDAFCYLILTQPEDTSESEAPRVLARSVIRRRFVREETPVAERDNESNSIIFYKSDGITPLDATDENSEEVESLRDVTLPLDEVEMLRQLSSSAVPSGQSPEDESFESGILEVYGPPMKRPRLSDTTPLDMDAETPISDETQQCSNVSHDQSANSNSESTSDSRPVVEPKKVAATYTDVDVCPTSNAAAVPTAGCDGDDRRDDRNEAMHGVEDPVPVTQDEDVEPSTLEEVSHHLQRIAEDLADDDNFDSILGHEWKDGVLMFVVRWKTDESSLQPFSLMKRDFPMEAAKYFLSHRVAKNTERYSTGGRYTRWARQFNRLTNSIIRRLIDRKSVV